MALAIGVAAVMPAAASAHSRRSQREQKICSTYRCRTVVATAQVRIFHAQDETQEYDSTFAEWLPTGRVTLLWDEAGFGAGGLLSPMLPGIVVSGRFAGYGIINSVDRYTGGFGERVARVNVQTGREQGWEANSKAGSGFLPNSPGITDVVATPAGSIAWIIDGSFDDPTGQTFEVTPPDSKVVYVVPSGSTTPVLVAYSAVIDPRSLAAIPGHIYWVEAGAAHIFGAP
jgi:hypothetical protein